MLVFEGIFDLPAYSSLRQRVSNVTTSSYGGERSNRIKRSEDWRERRGATSRERERLREVERGRHLEGWEESGAGWSGSGGVSVVESSCRLA